MTEITEVQMTTIIRVAERIAPKFAFDIYEASDMIQEAIMLGMECVQRYDSDRGPFENFVARHINNRLRTFVRKHSPRPEPDVPTSSLDYIHWDRSFGSKKRLQEALPLDLVQDEIVASTDVLDELALDEVQNIIDCQLPVIYRADYLRMLQNVHVPKARRDKIKQIILHILEVAGYETW